MRATYFLTIVVLMLTLSSLGSANAVPGYHIDSDKTAKQAVQQYGENNFQFEAACYQAALDKNLWRLALVAHDYLREKPKDPARECSFAQVYWKSQQVGVSETVPPAVAKQLQGWFDEAVLDTQDAVKKMPRSVSAHLTYGTYLERFVMGMGKVPQMQSEFKEAVALSPNVGQYHFQLADAYFSSGPLTRSEKEAMIAEYKRAVALDPRQTESYFFLAASYYQLQDWTNDRRYLNRYLKLRPEAASRPDIIATQKMLMEKLGSAG